MVHGDKIVRLVQAAAAGDKAAVQSAVAMIVAAEKVKGHTDLAERIAHAAKSDKRRAVGGLRLSPEAQKGQQYVAEVPARRTLAELTLPAPQQAAVEWFIQEQKDTALLQEHDLEPRHRLLLVGPPGNGKTSLAEALAEALAVPFFVVRYDAVIGSYLGETSSRLRQTFEYARANPCVLFFDEFDAVSKERGDQHETGEIKRVVSSLLMQVDDLPTHTVVIAATNHAELIDRAAWRRFQLRLDMPAPSTSELEAYFRKALDLFGSTPPVSPEEIVNGLGAISYAEAEQFVLDVRRRAVLLRGEYSLKAVVSDVLYTWARRAVPEGAA